MERVEETILEKLEFLNWEDRRETPLKIIRLDWWKLKKTIKSLEIPSKDKDKFWIVTVDIVMFAQNPTDNTCVTFEMY